MCQGEDTDVAVVCLTPHEEKLLADDTDVWMLFISSFCFLLWDICKQFPIFPVLAPFCLLVNDPGQEQFGGMDGPATSLL